MAFAQALRAASGTALAGALVFASAPSAAADQARSAEWPLTAYSAAKKVWPVSTGKGVVVAVIDTGVRATHVDLTGQVLPGTDFVHGGNGETDYSVSGFGHGTAMASEIAGHGHGPGDADGIMGLAPGAKILPIGINLTGEAKVEDNASSYLAQAIRYAVNHHAQVINMSLGTNRPSPEDQAAVAYAEQHNVVLVASAGNSGIDGIEYPAAYPGVIAAGGLNQDASRWTGSNYGHGLTVMAPAADVVGDDNGSNTQLGRGSGTSNSAAYVSAIAALVRAKFPSLTAGQVVNRIVKSASLPAGLTAPDPKWGYGAARPDKALTMDIPPGPANGPLPQAQAPGQTPGGASAPASQPTAPAHAAAKKSAASTTLIAIGAAVVVLLAVAVLVMVLLLRRRNSGGGPGGPGGGASSPYTYPPPYDSSGRF